MKRRKCFDAFVSFAPRRPFALSLCLVRYPPFIICDWLCAPLSVRRYLVDLSMNGNSMLPLLLLLLLLIQLAALSGVFYSQRHSLRLASYLVISTCTTYGWMAVLLSAPFK